MIAGPISSATTPTCKHVWIVATTDTGSVVVCALCHAPRKP